MLLKIKYLIKVNKVNISTSPEFSKLTAENFTARLAQVNLAGKNDIAAGTAMAA